MELWAHAHGYLALWRAARFTYRKTNSGSSFTVPFGGCCVELHANLSRRAALTLYVTVVPPFLLGFIATTLAHAQEQGHKESSFSVGVAVRAFVDGEGAIGRARGQDLLLQSSGTPQQVDSS